MNRLFGIDAECVQAIASLLFWGKIEEIPEVKYRYRLARSSVVEARVGDRT